MSLFGVCIRIQKFKNSGLLAHESEINKLQDEGDRLVDMKHPGSAAIQACLLAIVHIRKLYNEYNKPSQQLTWWCNLCLTVKCIEMNQTDFFLSALFLCLSCFKQTHRDAVQAEWQAFLNLCLAQETHLDNIEDYKKVKILWLLPNPSVHRCLLLRSDLFSNLVPAGCRDAVRVLGQTQFQSGPEISSRQEQPWSPVGTGGTTILCFNVVYAGEFWKV